MRTRVEQRVEECIAKKTRGYNEVNEIFELKYKVATAWTYILVYGVN